MEAALSVESPRRGRPAKPADQRLSAVVSIRVSGGIYDRICTMPELAGEKLDPVFRSMLVWMLNNPQKVRELLDTAA